MVNLHTHIYIVTNTQLEPILEKKKRTSYIWPGSYSVS